MSYTLCILGCGTMGTAILSGVFDSSSSSKPTIVHACVSRKSSATALKGRFPTIHIHTTDNAPAVAAASVILLASKPQLAHAILTAPGMGEALEGKLLISILAGTTIAQLEEWCPTSTTVVRAMPNTPTRIRQGMTVISPVPESPYVSRAGSPSAADSDCSSPLPRPLNYPSLVHALFSTLGLTRILPEKHFDVCTALCGSGPAFAVLFLEAMADGAVMMGLPRAEALEFAAQTMQGAARMVLHGDGAGGSVHPAQIRDAVTTPGGCTIAGLLALEDGRVRSTIARGIQIATERAAELGHTK